MTIEHVETGVLHKTPLMLAYGCRWPWWRDMSRYLVFRISDKMCRVMLAYIDVVGPGGGVCLQDKMCRVLRVSDT